jgi:hypothetical protein
VSLTYKSPFKVVLPFTVSPVKVGLLLIVTVAFAPIPVAVILFPTKLTKVIPPDVPTVEPSS